MSSLPSRDAAAGALLRHPVYVGSLLVLVLNDHVFKLAVAGGGDSLPALLTGKLSDLVGPVVAGGALAFVFGARGRSGRAFAFAAAAAFVAAINVSPALAAAVEALTAWLGVPWRVVVDAEDLLALLPLPWLVRPLLDAGATEAPTETGEATVAAVTTGRRRRWLEGGLLAAGALASAATSPPRPPLDLRELGWDAHLVLGNRSSRDVSVRVRRLRSGVALDCGRVAELPSELLSLDLFAPGRTFSLQSGRTLPIGGTLSPTQVGLDAEAFELRTPCDAVLIEAGQLSARVVFWHELDVPLKGVAKTTEKADPARLVAIEAIDGGGDGLRFASHKALFLPPQPVGTPPPGCAPTDDALVTSDSVEGFLLARDQDGEASPAIELTLTSLKSFEDGCHALGFAEVTLWACVPAGAMVFQVGQALALTSGPLAAGGGALTGYTIRSATHRLRVGRGEAPVLYGTSKWSVADAASCQPVVASCGQIAERVSLQLQTNVLQPPKSLALGLPFSLGEGRTLWLTQASRRLASDEKCVAWPGKVGVSLESVYLEAL